MMGYRMKPISRMQLLGFLLFCHAAGILDANRAQKSFWKIVVTASTDDTRDSLAESQSHHPVGKQDEVLNERTLSQTKGNHNSALTSPAAVTCRVLPLLPPSSECSSRQLRWALRLRAGGRPHGLTGRWRDAYGTEDRRLIHSGDFLIFHLALNHPHGQFNTAPRSAATTASALHWRDGKPMKRSEGAGTAVGPERFRNIIGSTVVV